MDKIKNEVKAFVKTLFWFLIACGLVPVLMLSFVFVHYNEKLVGYVLSLKYPNLTRSKSKNVRTVIDTKQNAGIFHFLLQVQGPCDFERIKRYYVEYLTDARDKMGNLRYPKLRQKLLSRWGHYFWDNDMSNFNIDNQVILATSVHKGRSVNDSNIQEYVSDFCFKYMLLENPQWQVIVIPVTSSANDEEDSHYYILVKLHHMIMVDEEDLHISELLMLKDCDASSRKRVIEIPQLSATSKSPSPMSRFVRKPEHIQRLLRHLGTLVVKRWNAFIYEYESLDTPDGIREPQIKSVTQLLSVLLILFVNVCMAYWRTMQARRKLQRRASRAPSSDAPNRFQLLLSLVHKEADLRCLTWPVAYKAVCWSWHPANVAKTWTKFLWRAHVNNVILIPYHVYRELMALRELVFRGRSNTDTHCGRLSLYVPMVVRAFIEFYHICYDVYKAPVNMYEELFQYSSKDSNSLQRQSLSGRKIVSFTKSIDATELRKRVKFTDNIRETDFILACVAGAIHDFFKENEENFAMPKTINTTCRSIAREYFTEHTCNEIQHVGGLSFLHLPLRPPDRQLAEQVHAIVESIRSKQIMIYAASQCQTQYELLTNAVPRVFTKICINYFSFMFPVIITEVYGNSSEFETLWGQKVEDVLLFRPPQSKAGCSLSIHHFGDKYRLAVMADERIGIQQTKISTYFEHYMKTLSF